MTLRNVFIGSGGIRAGWSIAIFFAIVAVEGAFLYFLSRLIHSHGRGGEIPAWALFVNEAANLVVIAIPTFVMSRIEKRPFLAYGYSGPRKFSRFSYGMLAGFIALSALIGILVLAHAIVIDKIDLSGGSILSDGIIWLIIFVLVGIAEESWTRGYLLFTLARGLNFFWAAMIMSAVFGAIHGNNPGESPIGLIAAAIIGLVFCLSVWLTGSLFWAVGFHAGWDWAQSYLFGVADSGLRVHGHLLDTHPAGNIWVSGGGTGPEGSLFVFLIQLLVALGLYIVWGRRPALRDKGSLFAQSSTSG